MRVRVRTAASPESRGKGVVVAMDDRIMSARDVKKNYARNGGFDVGEMGMLGVVANYGIEFFYGPMKKHTMSSDFDISTLKSLPRVGVSSSYAGAEGIADLQAEAIVVATTGFAPDERKYYEGLQKKGVIVATTFPSGEQLNSAPAPPDAGVTPVILMRHLNPMKARILMMLALTKTKSPQRL